MATTAYADPSLLLAPGARPSWNAAARPAIRRSLFGDIILIAFLLAQCFDGVFTYVGVTSFGVGIEANPLLAALMGTLGHGSALLFAKLLAAALGIGLHLQRVHAAVAMLTGFYLYVAIVPWALILF
jgi:uncharacterized membrane protein